LTAILFDNDRCEELAQRGATGDRSACQALTEYLWPRWLQMANSSRRVQMLSNADDASHDVAARLVEKFAQADGHTLRLYVSWKQRNPDKLFQDWFRIVTANVIRDYLRERNGSAQQDSTQRNDSPIGVKRLLNEFASAAALEHLGVRPPFTSAQTARELIEFAKGRLRPEQLSVFLAWLQGDTFEEIASTQGIDVASAQQALRASVAKLRRYFGEQ
jgi:DNA-directed RNA polymerase specialized sigma24 family protein